MSMQFSQEVEHLLSLLTNDETAVATAKQHLEIDHERSRPFQPELKFRKESPLAILNESEAEKGLLGFFNARSRRIRHRKFDKKIKKNPQSKVIVSEGDSWFQYPIFLKDIIDCLWEVDDWAIKSYGYGGDWLSNILEEAEYINAIRSYQPEVFLISGGGNDIVGDRLLKLLNQFDEGNADRPVKEYLNTEFDKALQDIRVLYRRLFSRLTNEFPKLHIIGHGYDYAIPGENSPLPFGGWLEKPMKEKGIEDPLLQRLIIQELIDSFNDVILGLIDDNKGFSGRVHFLDNRTLIKENEWFDELHPNNAAFQRVAEKFKSKIREILY